jgi:hypothetical protein
MKQDDDDINRDIRDLDNEDCRETSSSSDVEDHNLYNKQKIPHRDSACHYKIIHPTRVPLPMKQNCADTVIVRTSLPNLQHPAGAIPPPLPKREKSTINILPQSDIVPTQGLPLHQSGGNQIIPQQKGGGDHNVAQHAKATFNVAKWFIEAILFTKTHWQIISNEKYWMVDNAW